jgi:2-polyprenyl-6-methoxyphenol hydroxylase-like FAD-dependent oxidoreductase
MKVKLILFFNSLLLSSYCLLSKASKIKSHDVAIIGGGPAGLSTAIGIRRALGDDVKIAIFERSSALKEIGGQVGLISAAFNALDALDPSGELSTSVVNGGTLRKIFRLLDPDGTIINEVEIPPEAKQVVIAWFQLQRVLCDALPDGGDEMLHLGYELETVEENDEDDDVLLTFKGGHQCKAKIVIGADGNLSKVRAALFEDEVFPEYAGSCIWRMFLRGNYEGIDFGESNVWTGDGKVLAIQKMGSGDDSRVYVSGQAGWPKDDLHMLDRKRYIGSEDGKESGGSTQNQSRLERFMKKFDGFPQDVLDFAKKYHDSASILEHPIYFRPVGRAWGRGRVTLVGDAAHMIPPNMAMGTPLAFEDSVSLAHSFHRHGLTSKALRAYEEERQPRVNRIGYKAIKASGLYYMEKDEDSNPFKMNPNDQEIIKNFSQDPVPTATATH